MKFIKTPLPGVILIDPHVFSDSRGFFFETYRASLFAENGIPDPFVQHNHSKSSKGTLRGLHAQLKHPQGKLVRVLAGEIYDVAVDVRRGSPTYKKWFALTLSSDNFKMLYIPPGYAHGFYTLSDIAEVEYKVTDFYDPDSELRLLWNDPQINIQWPGQQPVLSAKDAAAQSLAALEPFLPVYTTVK
ncbi:MAG: dTDP-4-dehydrorhamnose 3,5-epimerase [Elusimicrobiota bacterium]|jgi:dTDP-4-dehydrorhamnose 3,5-epimerase